MKSHLFKYSKANKYIKSRLIGCGQAFRLILRQTSSVVDYKDKDLFQSTNKNLFQRYAAVYENNDISAGVEFKVFGPIFSYACCPVGYPQPHQQSMDNFIVIPKCDTRLIQLSNLLSMGASMGKNASLLDALPSGQGTLHVVMLGLDSAGKTTALYRLKFDQYLNTVPTIGFNCEKVKGMVGKAKGINFLVWDVGGQEKLRPLWKSYTRCTDGILFVLDSVDTERMEEAKMELTRTVKSPENSSVPILVLANKQDLPGAREPCELEKLLGLTELGNGGAVGSHLWHVQPACAITGDGLHEGLEVLYEMILKRRKLAKERKKKCR